MHSKNCAIIRTLAVLSLFASALTGFVLWLFLPVAGLHASRQTWLNVHIYSSIAFVIIVIAGFITGCNYWQETVDVLRGKRL